jgi:hypothetical protein
MTPRAYYEHKLISGVLCVIDLNQAGARSVTNDAEKVVAELYAKGLLPEGRQLIYRDTEGMWDEMLWQGAGKFAGFAMLRTHSLLDALAMIRKEAPRP